MIKFIEVDIANSESKTLVNVYKIVNIGTHYKSGNGYISFNSSGSSQENHISPNRKVTEAHINEADKLNSLG